MHGPEGSEERRDPDDEDAAELRGAAYYERRLQLAKLLASEEGMASTEGFQAARRFDFGVGDAQPGDGAHVRQAARGVVDAARDELPLGRFGEDSEVRQQVLAGGEIVQVQKLLVGEPGFDFGEGSRFGAIEQEEADKQGERAGQHPDGFAAPPHDAVEHAGALSAAGCRGPFRGSAASYRHCESNLDSKLWRGTGAGHLAGRSRNGSGGYQGARVKSQVSPKDLSPCPPNSSKAS